MVWRELAFEISLTSLGSSQILRLPQPTTDAARRFCVLRFTLCEIVVSAGQSKWGDIMSFKCGTANAMRAERDVQCDR